MNELSRIKKILIIKTSIKLDSMKHVIISVHHNDIFVNCNNNNNNCGSRNLEF